MAKKRRGGKKMAPSLTMWLAFFVLLVALSVGFFFVDEEDQLPPTEASPWDWHETEPDLKPMAVDFLGKEKKETFWAYVTPDIAQFYHEPPGRSLAVREPRNPGQYAKIFNLSPQKVHLHWYAGADKAGPHIADISPFDVVGTSTQPGQQFYVTPPNNHNTILVQWRVTNGSNLLVWDPLQGQDASKTLTKRELQKYNLQKDNLLFADEYRKMTGRDWLALYGYQKAPKYPLWRADFFGQTHVVPTKETHFTAIPPEEEIKPFTPEKSKPRQLQEYRSPDTLNLTLKAISCSPRVFEIPNFLSDVEADHVLHLATGMNLSLSGTKHGSKSAVQQGRSSKNTWVARESSPIIDAIYRRAADLLQIDEALMRKRSKDEDVDLETSASIAENLQLVHYGVGKEYQSHHDFREAPLENKDQPARYATILFYLNDDMKGGETSFPLWMNAETEDALKVTPEKGKAVLFYNMLPDGNMDEKSQHAALPVLRGEKWLTNLWVWSPYYKTN